MPEPDRETLIQLGELKAEAAALDERVEDLETAAERRHEWKRGPFLLAAVALFTVLVTDAVNILIATHHI